MASSTRRGSRTFVGPLQGQIPLFSDGRDGHPSSSKGLYIHYKDFLVKVG